jgi:anti-anti-sigma factor
MASPVAEKSWKTHALALTFGRRDAYVSVSGEIDYTSVPNLARLFESLDRLQAPVHVDMADVTFLDSSGMTPVVDAARHRRGLAMPPIMVERCSRVARRFIDVAGLRGDPLLDVDAWDRLSGIGRA